MNCTQTLKAPISKNKTYYQLGTHTTFIVFADHILPKLRYFFDLRVKDNPDLYRNNLGNKNQGYDLICEIAADILGLTHSAVVRRVYGMLTNQQKILNDKTADALLVAVGETFQTQNIGVFPSKYIGAQMMTEAYSFATGEQFTLEQQTAISEELLGISHAIFDDTKRVVPISQVAHNIIRGEFPCQIVSSFPSKTGRKPPRYPHIGQRHGEKYGHTSRAYLKTQKTKKPLSGFAETIGSTITSGGGTSENGASSRTGQKAIR